ncbi:MAG: MazG nucleotide pyrophosphohydrolase domain-containing protein, partial [Dehalococcoidia bacterium]
MTIQIVGLGPAGAELVTAETLALLQGANHVIVRTRHHPAVAELDPAGAWESCDDLYGSGDSFDGTYRRIAERVVQGGTAAGMVYAVPGNPLIAEASVPLVVELARAAGIAVKVRPALGYPDVAAIALERDLHDIQLCDALALRLDTWRPALVGQVHSRDVATSLKLQLLDFMPADHQVAWLHSLATPDQVVTWMPLSELDHRPWGYLDTLFVPPLEPLADVRRFDGFWHVIERLHSPDGCPWDREQTHLSLRTHLLEEAYELLEAIDADDPDRIAEELGDVLLQVAMHSAVGERSGRFG